MKQIHPYLQQWFEFCPNCTTRLTVDDINLVHCSACNFHFYNNPTPAVAVLIEQNNKLLFAKRARQPQQGLWDNPGGFIDPGETAEQAVIREIKEETTLEIEIMKLLGTAADTYEKEPTLNLIYLVSVSSGSPQPQDDVAELAWFTPSEILQEDIAFTNTRIAIQLYQQYRKEHP